MSKRLTEEVDAHPEEFGVEGSRSRGQRLRQLLELGASVARYRVQEQRRQRVYEALAEDREYQAAAEVAYEEAVAARHF